MCFFPRPWPQIPITLNVAYPVWFVHSFAARRALLKAKFLGILVAKTAPVVSTRSDYRGFVWVCDIISGRLIWLIGTAASIVAVSQPNSTEVGSQNRSWAALSTFADAKMLPTPSCTDKGFCRITNGRSDSHLVALSINLSWSLFAWILAGWRAMIFSGHFRLFPTKVVVLSFPP